MFRPSLRVGGLVSRRCLSGGAPKKPESIFDINDRLRKASEDHLESTRKRLLDDVADRQADMGSMRSVIHSKSLTVHAPPAALYSQRDAFRFPELASMHQDSLSILVRKLHAEGPVSVMRDTSEEMEESS